MEKSNKTLNKLSKYIKLCKRKRELLNAFSSNQGLFRLVLDGIDYKCKKIEGFIVISDKKEVIDFMENRVTIYMPKHDRYILFINGERIYSSGFEEDGLGKCELFIHIVTDTKELILIDIGNRNSPTWVVLSEVEKKIIRISDFIENFTFLIKKGYKEVMQQWSDVDGNKDLNGMLP